MTSILDQRRFKYTPAAQTDIRETFKRARRKLQREQEQAKANQEEAERKVKPIARAK